MNEIVYIMNFLPNILLQEKIRVCSGCISHPQSQSTSYNSSRAPVACKPDTALFKTASGSLASDMPSKHCKTANIPRSAFQS